MATSVFVLCSNAKRLNIKVTPNTSILQILEEACSKQKLDPLEFDLVHQRKVLDLSLSVRFANLANNALLELHPSQKGRKSESNVGVCLQCENGGRLIHDFLPGCTLWDVLQHWQQKNGQNVLTGGANEDTEPVCLYMRKEVVGEENLRKTSLRDLGLTSGKAVIRLFYRVPETLKSQAHVESINLRSKIEEIPKSIVFEAIPEKNLNSGASQEQVENSKEDGHINVEMEVEDKDDISKDIPEKTDVPIISEEPSKSSGSVVHRLSEPVVHDTSEELMEENDEINYVGDRDAVIYDARYASSNVTENLPDDFFELTAEDARYLYATLQKQRKDMENEVLCTSSYKQAKKLQGMLRFKNTILRIQFPDQIVLQARFSTLEKVSSVVEFIGKFLTDEGMEFHLFTTPPKTVLNPEHALFEAELVPASLVHVGCVHHGRSTLKPEVLSKMSSHRAACQAAALIRASSKPSEKTEIEDALPPPIQATVASTSNQNQPQFQQEQAAGNVISTPSTPTKVPKWFRTGQK